MGTDTGNPQEWLERMADTWLTNPEVTPVYPLGLVIKDAGWRVTLEPVTLTAATAYERIKTADDVEFYAILADGREVTTRRPLASMTWAATPSWQRRQACCCGSEDCDGRS